MSQSRVSVKFEFTNPFSRDGTLATPMGDFSCRWRDLAYQIVVVDALLEMVAPPVRYHLRIEHVDLADSPSIEPGLREEFFEQIVISYLHVSGTQPDAFHKRPAW